MDIKPTDVDEIRYLVSQGKGESLRTVSVNSFTLGAALELAICRMVWEHEGCNVGVQLFHKWASEHPVLLQSWQILNEHHWPSVTHQGLFGVPDYEICPVPWSTEIQHSNWTEFLQRFTRSLEQNGSFTLNLARALARLLWEMADNVIEHSGPNPETPAPGIVAYRVSHKRMHYAVADIGRGVMASLRSNPQWQNIENSDAALLAAIREHASRRATGEHDGGFRQVETTLMDFNGLLRYRSGNGLLTLNGRGENRQVVSGPSSPPMQGFQLSVSCDLN